MPFARLGLSTILGAPLVVGALICALAALLGQLGRRSASWDVLTHAAPFYLLGGLLALVGGLFLDEPMRTWAIVFGGIATFAALLLMAPEYLRSSGPRAEAKAPGAFKVIQFNVWGGRGDLARTIAWINREAPDAIVMQETTRALRQAIAAGTGLHLTPNRSPTAIFTRQAPLADLAQREGRDGPMMLSAVRLQTALGETRVLAVHYPWPTELDRLIGVPKLVQAIRSCAWQTTILAGDFNSTPWSFARRREDDTFGLVRRTRARFSWPAWLGIPLLPIDHVYAGAAWATVKVRRGPNLGSDHYPLVVILAPHAPPQGDLPGANAQP